MFRMDPAKGKPPTKIHKAENCTAEQRKEMIDQAKKRLKDRVQLSSGFFYLCGLNVQACIKRIFTCSSTRYGKVLDQGKRSIYRDLNLMNFLKKQRELQAAMWALTTPETRRLIAHQVKAGLLVAPLDGGGQAAGAEETIVRKDKNGNPIPLTREERRAAALAKKTDRLWDSSDENSSSDEDFKFLDAIASGKTNMTEMEAKLI